VRELAAQASATPDGLHLVVLDGRTSPSIDVTAAGMLVQLRADLRRLGADLVPAENVGQVRLAGGPAAAVHREWVSP
jgi:sulfate permease, SulP family